MKNQTTPEQKNCATPSTPETRFSEPQYNEILNLMNKF